MFKNDNPLLRIYWHIIAQNRSSSLDAAATYKLSEYSL